jgi:hypothetical protein
MENPFQYTARDIKLRESNVGSQPALNNSFAHNTQSLFQMNAIANSASRNGGEYFNHEEIPTRKSRMSK